MQEPRGSEESGFECPDCWEAGVRCLAAPCPGITSWKALWEFPVARLFRLKQHLPPFPTLCCEDVTGQEFLSKKMP